MESSLNCSKHGSKVLAVCCGVECRRRLACSKCLVYEHTECEKNFIFIEDLNSNNVGTILQIPILENVFPKEKYADIFTPSQDSTFTNQVSSIITELIDNLKEAVKDFEEDLLKAFENKLKVQDFQSKIGNILELEKLKGMLRTTEIDNLPSSLNQLKINSIRKLETVRNLREYKKEIIKNIESLDSISNLKVLVSEITFKVKEKLKKETVLRESFKFDSNKTNLYHIISSRNTVIEHWYKDKHFACTLLNTILKPKTGIYSWNLMFTGLKKYGEGSNYWGYWGILEESKWDLDRTHFKIKEGMSFSTDNRCYGGIEWFVNRIGREYEGEIIECTFDTKTCIFTTRCGDKLLCTGKAKKGITYRPHVVTFKKGNKCTIIQ